MSQLSIILALISSPTSLRLLREITCYQVAEASRWLGEIQLHDPPVPVACPRWENGPMPEIERKWLPLEG